MRWEHGGVLSRANACVGTLVFRKAVVAIAADVDFGLLKVPDD